MSADTFGCLHTEEVSEHKVKVLTFSPKIHLFAYVRQDANVLSEGTRPAGEGACRSTTFFSHVQIYLHFCFFLPPQALFILPDIIRRFHLYFGHVLCLPFVS